jgi:putative heme-binding domain-containing protein
MIRISLYLVVGILLMNTVLDAQLEDRYADSPDWYKPGHPVNPAEPAAIETLPGYSVEKVIDVPEAVGSVTALTIDERGNLIFGTQLKQGLYRIIPSATGSEASSKLEPLLGEGATIGWVQGLLYAFDSLYVTVAEKNDFWETGLYRLTDSDGDGVLDKNQQLLKLDGSGEHGPHNLVVGPSGKYIYMVCGNGTPVPESVKDRKTVRTEGIDHLMPNGFENTRFTDAAFVLRLNPDGSEPQLMAGGLRNPYDIAFNETGDLFTFDSDMEYDLGTPFYRPTRICHIVSGSEFGWRSSAGKWPEYYEDSVAPVLNIGPSSPTGLVFGYDTAFPGKYKEALFALDWTFATIYAVHLTPKGASYTATFETFLSGTGLPLTDAVVGRDGAIYFSVGGRRLGSAIYRVWYSGPEVETSNRVGATPSENESRDLRLSLESYHGKVNPKVIDQVWPHLGSEDRAVRYAARIALESQPIEQWRDRVFKENSLQARLPALLALARQGNEADALQVVDALSEMEFARVSKEGLLVALRILEVALGKGGYELKELGKALSDQLRPLLPHASRNVNRELSRLLCYLDDREAIDPLLDLMAQDVGEVQIEAAELVARNLRYGSPVMEMLQAAPLKERMHHAQMLNWIKDGWSLDQRKRYFSLAVDAVKTSKGGNGYVIFWDQILETAKSNLSVSEADSLSGILEGLEVVVEIPKPKGSGKIWELAYMSSLVSNGFGVRDYENGKKMYAAASCLSCHVMNEEGGIAGPNLTTVGQRFTVIDLLDSIINPSNSISDQYQVVTLRLRDGEVLSGRIHSKDAQTTVIATNALKPMQTRTIQNSNIMDATPLPVSTMPPALLNALNEQEVLDLLAYILAGGDANHALFR